MSAYPKYHSHMIQCFVLFFSKHIIPVIFRQLIYYSISKCKINITYSVFQWEKMAFFYRMDKIDYFINF